jgi:hypothetical protein
MRQTLQDVLVTHTCHDETSPPESNNEFGHCEVTLSPGTPILGPGNSPAARHSELRLWSRGITEPSPGRIGRCSGGFGSDECERKCRIVGPALSLRDTMSPGRADVASHSPQRGHRPALCFASNLLPPLISSRKVPYPSAGNFHPSHGQTGCTTGARTVYRRQSLSHGCTTSVESLWQTITLKTSSGGIFRTRSRQRIRLKASCAGWPKKAMTRGRTHCSSNTRRKREVRSTG